MSVLLDSSILVVKPPRLDGASCLVVDRYASFVVGGPTDVARLLSTAKDTAAANRRRSEASEQLWTRVREAANCIPHTHPARRATAIVHVPMSPSNRFAINAVACAVSEALGIGVYSDCLLKRVPTAKMKGATPQVKASISRSFAVDKLPSGPLLVIDDLVETGATLAEAGRALDEAGAVEYTYLAAVWLD